MLSIVVQVLLGITVLMTAHYIVPGKFGTFEIFAELHQLVACSCSCRLLSTCM
jgi:hypothetical protein